MNTEYSTAIAVLKNSLWNELSNTTLNQAVENFLKNLSPNTQRTYKTAFKYIFRLLEEKNLLSINSSLQVFAICNMENLLDCILNHCQGSIGTKKGRCAAFVSLTKHLDRLTGGMIRTVRPIKGVHFRATRSKAYTKAMTHEEWNRFIVELRKISIRDYLIAKAMFQGAKRVSEVLTAKIDQIDWQNGRISYKQAKTKIHFHQTVISYSSDFMDELKMYLFGRKDGLIFLTNQGHIVSQSHTYRSFNKASKKAGLITKVHPHVLRTTAITLLMKMGYHSDDVMKISGHANPKDVLYYDKRAEEENLTTRVKLC